VGSTTSQVFTPDAVSIICHYSKGIPRTINILCDNAFLIGPWSGQQEDQCFDHSGSHPAHGGCACKRIAPDRKLNTRKESAPFPQDSNAGCPESPMPRCRLFFWSSPYSWPEDTWGASRRTWGCGPFGRQLADGQKAGLLPGEFKRDIPPETGTAPVDQQGPDASPLPAPPAPVVQPQPKPEIRVKTVSIEEGATIYTLSQKYYQISNTSLADYILGFNPDITNPDLIRADSKVKIPEIQEESLIIRGLDNTCKVHLGTFLRPELARQYKDEPALQGKEIEVVPRKFSNGDVWYRVMAGNFPSWEESLETIQALKGKGVLPFF